AILAELLLRGAQTEGELRGRASRMEPIDDLDKLRQVLQPLAQRKLIVFLGPEGRRGTLITHGFLSPDELASARSRASPEAAEPPPPRSAPPPANWEQTAADLRKDIAELRQELQTLRRLFEQASERGAATPSRESGPESP